MEPTVRLHLNLTEIVNIIGTLSEQFNLKLFSIMVS